ncbi:hypothetical protein DTO280E4_2171 [Paecilomyces variotii]|nr:hypothetical protein DTO280E4_2171 [Paecilomyces variotii]
MNRFGPYRLGDCAAMIEFVKIIIAIMLKRSSSATSSLTSCPGICLCLWSRASKTKIQRHQLLLRDASKTCDERSCGSSINPGRTPRGPPPRGGGGGGGGGGRGGGGGPEAPIIVPSETGSDSSDVSELLRQLRGLLLEFRFGSDLSRFTLYRTIALLRG